MSRKWTVIWLVFVFALFLLTAILCFHKNNPVLLIVSEIAIPVLFGITIWIIDRILKPYTTMSKSINMLKEGDFSSTLVRTGNKEADSLIDTYNSMIRRLREEKLSIREKNHFLDLLIDSSPMGIIILDLDEKIIEINNAGCRYLAITGSIFKGKRLSETGNQLAGIISKIDYDTRQSIALPDGEKYSCLKLFFMDRGFKHPFFIIEEMTGEIRKAEKEAYGKLIRMMAHEVNNTIGSVNSIMLSVADNPASFIEQDREEILSVLNVAIQRNYQMKRFMQGFSNVVKLPLPEKEAVDLNMSVRLVADSFRPSLKDKNARLILDLDSSFPEVFVDRSQMEQLFSNIVKNSAEAISQDGMIRISSQAQPPMISFEDDGPGLSENISDKLFTPFFSTKPGGQGIGLTLVREILINHGLRFTFQNRISKGAVFTIHFESRPDNPLSICL
jgi:nitrogen fixation/metabolism regulation signal transduction histidine kinase